jgi:rubrerythrin
MGAATGLAASLVGLASSAASAAQESTPEGTPAGGDTAANLQTAIAGEAQAHLKYMAYGLQAMQEGHPEIAQLFYEAAGAETTHGINHMKVAGSIKSTRDNLNDSAYGENYENEVMYPQFIEQARAEGREDAAASFQLAMERELYHRDMFQQALETLES